VADPIEAATREADALVAAYPREPAPSARAGLWDVRHALRLAADAPFVGPGMVSREAVVRLAAAARGAFVARLAESRADPYSGFAEYAAHHGGSADDLDGLADRLITRWEYAADDVRHVRTALWNVQVHLTRLAVADPRLGLDAVGDLAVAARGAVIALLVEKHHGTPGA
jgi:hypothetical protein